MQPSSLRAIAKAANVSVSTVSRALSDHDSIRSKVRPQTLERVLTIAENAGYTPNVIARSLITNSTNTIGLVVTSAGDPWYSRIIEVAENVLKSVGWNLFIGYSHNNIDRELEVIKSFQKRRVDGIMLASSLIGTTSTHLQWLLRSNAKVLMINRQGQGMLEDFLYVGVDDELGGKMATNFLLQNRHTRIAYIGVEDRPRSNMRRKKGYLQALRDAGVEEKEDLVYTISVGDQPMEAGVELSKQLVADKIAPRIQSGEITALFCFNDISAVGALLGCKDQGIKVPSQCSIVGFDGLTVTKFTSPSITTIRQPREKMGSYGTQLLLSHVGLRDTRVKNYLEDIGAHHLRSIPFMPPELIIGESTAMLTGK